MNNYHYSVRQKLESMRNVYSNYMTSDGHNQSLGKDFDNGYETAMKWMSRTIVAEIDDMLANLDKNSKNGDLLV